VWDGSLRKGNKKMLNSIKRKSTLVIAMLVIVSMFTLVRASAYTYTTTILVGNNPYTQHAYSGTWQEGPYYTYNPAGTADMLYWGFNDSLIDQDFVKAYSKSYDHYGAIYRNGSWYNGSVVGPTQWSEPFLIHRHPVDDVYINYAEVIRR
jgi:hypothetical protein